MEQPIQVTRSSLPNFEEYCNEIRDLWDSRWLTNMGVKHRSLQAELERYLSVPYVTLFTNGHIALETVIASFGFPRGSEVITTPFTFASTTHAIAKNGLIPVFCDVTRDTYTLDPAKLEALITPKTVAVVPVHVYGNVCDVEAIDAVAKRHGLKVIYDAAHAFGVRYRGKGVASFGDASMFSFHATKVFNTIEGGAVCYGDGAMASVLDDCKNFGLHTSEDVPFVAGNGKMSEFQAAMGLCNLRHLEEEINKRGVAVQQYRKRLSDVKGIVLCPEQAEVIPNYAYFPVVFDGYKETRDQVFEKLKAQGVLARKYFYPLTNGFACYQTLPTAGEEKTPVAKYYADRVLTLPLFADLTTEQVDFICDMILA